ncbi:hypothetical protein F2Q69_00048456 [Brassica cretica]|uniref:Uncharacterized protein n=1 Tax=Brassica cretica TaxID=69181 RepID=A0A8S9PZH1_BRACR|nr:hypothetical protein F2Q69_00048456 [Brassica cretica]
MAATKMVFHRMVLIFHSFKSFSDLDLDIQVFQIWKTSGLEDFQEVFHTTSRKSSTRLPGSLPHDFQEVSHTTSRKSSDGVLIRWFTSTTWICFTDLGMIYMFFRSGSDFGRPMGSLLGSLLKYNALEDFQEVFQTISRKFSDGVFFHIKWSLSFSL